MMDPQAKTRITLHFTKLGVEIPLDGKTIGHYEKLMLIQRTVVLWC